MTLCCSRPPNSRALGEVMLSEIAPGLDRLSCLITSAVRSAPSTGQRHARGRARAMTVGAMLQRRRHLRASNLCAGRPCGARTLGLCRGAAHWAHLARKRATHRSIPSLPGERGRGGLRSFRRLAGGFETVPGGRVGGRLAPKLVRRPCPRKPEDADFVGVLAWWSRGGSNP
jgi:hypothetical protein